MADDVEVRVESALNSLLNVTEKSGNLRNDLRKDIFNSVSELRKVFCKLKKEVEEKNDKIKKLEQEVKKSGSHACSSQHAVKNKVEQCAPSLRGSYASAVRGERPATREKHFKLFVKSKQNESPEAVKVLLKKNVNPTQLKIGIRSMKSVKDGRIIIESGSKEEIDLLSKKITEKCSHVLEVHTPSLRKPNIIIYDVPEDIGTDNLAATILTQNPELHLTMDSIRPKYSFKNKKKIKNVIAEVEPETWRILAQSKIKLGWQLCKVADYVKVVRCFKCSKYGHQAQVCKGEEACPRCAGKHKLQECSAPEGELKCVNCMTHNKHNPNNRVDENHSSMNKDCNSLHNLIRRYKQNTEY